MLAELGRVIQLLLVTYGEALIGHEELHFYLQLDEVTIAILQEKRQPPRVTLVSAKTSSKC